MKVLLNRLALWWLGRQMRKDFGYAWAWHCNLAMASQDEGLDHAASNRAAGRFMFSLFNIDTTPNEARRKDSDK